MNILKLPASSYIVLTAITFALLAATCVSNDPEITEPELMGHIKILSSDKLSGRMTGTEGDSLAASYIRKELVSAGLTTLGKEGFQSFKVTKGIVSGKNNHLAVNGEAATPEKDFTPFAFSSTDRLEAEVIFTGYGFSISNDSIKWNDYDKTDVRGKWVMILRADPGPENAAGMFLPYSGDRTKALNARDQGAAGVLLVSGKQTDAADAFDPLNPGDFSVGIPAFRIRRELADRILAGTGKTIESLEKEISSEKKPMAIETKTKVDAKADVSRETASTRNVVMVLPGEDPVLRNEYVIVGAHFDHLGMGGPGSSSRAVDTVGVHHGADDNASGVAMMIELAEKFAKTKGSHKRSIVFTAFSGEEEGLLGSKQFTAEPSIDLTKVNAMINMDMIGRMNEYNNLFISGTGTAKGLRDLVKKGVDTTALRLVLSDEGYGPSDHSSFYGKNIPVLFYFTGAHLDYHTPADTWERINSAGMMKIADHAYNIISELASDPSRLEFTESGPKTTVTTRRMKGATLGIMPDFAGVVKNGLRADFVTPGKPAALGGMKKGDIITAINGKSINNIQDYMSRMQELKQGQTISVEVIRNDRKEVLLIQL